MTQIYQYKFLYFHLNNKWPELYLSEEASKSEIGPVVCPIELVLHIHGRNILLEMSSRLLTTVNQGPQHNGRYIAVDRVTCLQIACENFHAID